jgi:hypothetical protein
MTANESRDKNSDASFEQSLEIVTVFKEAGRDLIIIFIFHKAVLRFKRKILF